MKNSPEIHIRPATEKDMPALLEFEQGVIAAERPFDETLKSDGIHYYDLDALITSDDALLCVARVNSEIVGSGYARIDAARPYLRHSRYAYLGFMYVKEAWRGKGIIRMILSELESWVKGKGLSEMRLDVYCQNKAALNAYRKAGFDEHLLTMRKGI